jgi:hypothetical protein
VGFDQPTQFAFSSQVVASLGGFFVAYLQAPVPPGFPETRPELCWLLILFAALTGAVVACVIPRKSKRVE